MNITIQTGEAQRAQKGSNEEGRKKIKKNKKEQQIKGEETKDDGFKKEKRKRVAIWNPDERTRFLYCRSYGLFGNQ